MHKKRIRLLYYNHQPAIYDSDVSRFEKYLKALYEAEFMPARNLLDLAGMRCDLVIVSARHVPTEEFPQWLKGVRQKLYAPDTLSVPVLIYAELDFEQQAQVYMHAAQENWYFDILSSQELNSLPIRVANLLRIYDHLHEIKRYAQTLDELQQEVAEMTNKLNKMKRT